MSNDYLNKLLKYHQNLIDPEFLRSVMQKINQRNKQRSLIMIVFTVLGTFATVISTVLLKPSFTFVDSTNNLMTISLTAISLFIIWLIFEENEASN